jgi:hypothetical protein
METSGSAGGEDEAVPEPEIPPFKQLTKVDKASLLQVISEWLATPYEARPETTLTALARRLGVPYRAVVQIANSDEAIHRSLQIVAAGSLHSLPQIIEVMTREALKGKARHGEIVLEWVRKFNESSRLHNQQEKRLSLDAWALSASQTLAGLNRLVAYLGDDEETARAKLNQMKEVEDAEYTEVDGDRPEGAGGDGDSGAGQQPQD